MLQSRAPDDRSFGETLGAVVHDLQSLVRGEVALARAEIRKNVREVAKPGAIIVGGALLAIAGLITVVLGIAAALTLWLPAWAALLLTGVVVIAIAGLMCKAGMDQISSQHPEPKRTVENVERDVQAVQEHV